MKCDMYYQKSSWELNESIEGRMEKVIARGVLSRDYPVQYVSVFICLLPSRAYRKASLTVTTSY